MWEDAVYTNRKVKSMYDFQVDEQGEEDMIKEHRDYEPLAWISIALVILGLSCIGLYTVTGWVFN